MAESADDDNGELVDTYYCRVVDAVSGSGGTIWTRRPTESSALSAVRGFLDESFSDAEVPPTAVEVLDERAVIHLESLDDVVVSVERRIADGDLVITTDGDGAALLYAWCWQWRADDLWPDH